MGKQEKMRRQERSEAKGCHPEPWQRHGEGPNDGVGTDAAEGEQPLLPKPNWKCNFFRPHALPGIPLPA